MAEKHPVEEMIERFQALLVQHDRDAKSIELLLEYIEYFHKEMTDVSNRVADKTAELFKELAELAHE